MSKQLETVALSLVTADPHQPRRNFDATRLSELSSSIKKHGIMNPLIVEKTANGYILVDGERRFRVAKSLNLKEVPVIVMPAQSDTERLIQQFHLQEQHENWSATEKAIAVSQLAKQLGVSAREMAATLSLSSRTISDYVAFTRIIDKKSFEKGEIPLSFARVILNLRNHTKKQWMAAGEEFTSEMEEKLEQVVIARIKSGEITNQSDITKIRDSITTDYASVNKLLKSNITIDRLFLDTSAKAANHARNVKNLINNLTSHIVALNNAGGRDLILEDEGVQVSLKTLHKALATIEA